MEQRKVIPLYFDLNNHSHNQTNFFFLEHLLKARADLHLESGQHDFDQEVNVYIAGLLNSLIASNTQFLQKPYISAFDTDIRSWLESHPGYRNEYVVYRDNADFGLILSGLFLGHNHKGSYQHLVMPESDDQGRVALYYEFAASALQHLKGNDISLTNVFYAIADTIPEVLKILRRAASSYFDLMERISEGSIYHIEKELSEKGQERQYQLLLDDFLEIYAKYKENPTVEIKAKMIDLSMRLKDINKSFRFEIS